MTCDTEKVFASVIGWRPKPLHQLLATVETRFIPVSLKTRTLPSRHIGSRSQSVHVTSRGTSEEKRANATILFILN